MDPTTLVPGIFNQQSAGTPTPQQIQSAYAQANTMKGQGLTTEPVHAWTQGVNQMLKALLGHCWGATRAPRPTHFSARRTARRRARSRERQ